MGKTPVRGSARKGGRKLGQKATRPASEHQRAVNRANAAGPRGAMPDEVRALLSEGKGRLGRVLALKGIPHVEAIIDEGPTHDHFQWAMDFAADRAGMPRRREEQIDAENMPEMVIQFRNYTPPSE